MKKKKGYLMVLVFVCITTLVVPPCSYSQGSQSTGIQGRRARADPRPHCALP